jgi:hypothetical protein
MVLITVRGLIEPRAIVQPEGSGKLKKKIHLIGTRTRALPVIHKLTYLLTYVRS